MQIASAVPQQPQTTVRVRFSKAQAAGNTNVLVIGWNDDTSRIVSVSDSAGNTYRVAAATVRGQDLSQAMYYASNVKGGSNSVTVTFSGAVPFADISAAEYSGLDASAPFDGSTSVTGTSGQAKTASLATTGSHDVLVAAGTTQGAFTAAGAGYTIRVITRPDADIVEDRVVSAAGSYSASASVQGSWVFQLVALRATN